MEQTSGTIEAAWLLRCILQLYLWSAEAEFRVTCWPGGFSCPGWVWAHLHVWDMGLRVIATCKQQSNETYELPLVYLT